MTGQPSSWGTYLIQGAAPPPGTHCRRRWNLLKFGSHLHLDSDLGMLKRILQHCEKWNFPHIGWYL